MAVAMDCDTRSRGGCSGRSFERARFVEDCRSAGKEAGACGSAKHVEILGRKGE
jgi:hypothetical protein